MKEYQTYLQNVNIVSVTSVFAVHERVFSHVLLVVQTWLLSPSLIYFIACYCVMCAHVCLCVITSLQIKKMLVQQTFFWNVAKC